MERKESIPFFMHIVFLVSFFMMASGCISTKVTSYVSPLRPHKPKTHPIKMTDIENETRPYQVVGSITIHSSSVYTVDMILPKLQKQARKLGGDALSDISQEPIPKKYWYFFDWLNFYGNRWSAEVIEWKSEL